MASIRTLLLALATLLATLPALAQSFPITINATPLSAPTITIPGQLSFPRNTIQNLSLPAGNYTIGYPASPAAADVTVPFTVTPAGTISYAPSLQGILLGSGTTTLTLNGVYMIFDNRTLFLPDLPDLTISGHGTVPLPKAFFDGRFLPGLHRLSYAAGVSTAFADFTINATGVVSYAPTFEGVFQGSGTGLLTLNGAIIQINNTFLSAPDVRITALYPNSPAPHTTFTAAVLPGVHVVSYESSAAGQDAAVAFTVNPNSTVSYGPTLQGILLGNNTGALTLQGAAITADNSFLSSTSVNLGGVYDLAPAPNTALSLRLLPGDHDISYPSTPTGARAATTFAVNPDATVSYALDQQDVLLGAGTSALTIRGRDLVIDNSYLLATNTELFGIGALANDTSAVTLLPGTHAVRYQASSANPAAGADFAMLASGTVDYDPSLQGALLGAATNVLTIEGFELTAALPEWDPASAFFYASPTFNSCQPIRVLPGWHTLATASPAPDAIELLITSAGGIDFDTAYDADWAGRATNFLQQRDASGVPALCNQPPVAIVDPAEIIIEATSPSGAYVTLNASSSFDPDLDTLTYDWAVSDLSVVLSDADTPTPSGFFAVGVTMATVTVTDPTGAYSTADVVIRVVDTTPPSVFCSSDRAYLWPPTHKMKVVQLEVRITDTAGAALLLQATLRSDEPDNAIGFGDGNTQGDTNGSDGFTAPVDVTSLFTFDPSRGPAGAWVATVLLRAERKFPGDGRAYTLDVVAVDAAMNISDCSTVIVVPRLWRGGC